MERSGLVSRPWNAVVQRPARQIPAHPKRCLNTLVVAGKVSERAIPHTPIEELCSFVPRAHFQIDLEYARYDGAFLEPLEKLAPEPCSSIGRSHGEKVQVRVVVSVAHDRKPGNVTVNARDEDVNIGCANTRGYPHRCPTPPETVFD
jgi:hypothetical protein